MQKRLKILCALIIFIIIAPNIVKAFDDGQSETQYFRGKILQVHEVDFKEGVEGDTEQKSVDEWLEDDHLEDNNQHIDGFFTGKQLVKAKILNGRFKDKVVDIENMLSGNPGIDIKVEQNDEVLLLLELKDDEIANAHIADYMRIKYLKYILLLFVVVILLVGGLKGIKTLLTLGLTIAIIYKVLLPLMLSGYSPVLVTIITSIIITVIVMLTVGGINEKSIAAIVGTVIGVCIAGIIAYFIGNAARLTGFSMEEAQMLSFIPQNVDFDLEGLLFSGIIIGSLGAVMDVAMSISSSIYEIGSVNPDLDLAQLIRSGMNIGRDVMGTMSNTLILAYAGSAIPMMLLFMAYNNPFDRIINMDLIATEVVRALAGSIGLVMTIPITAVIAALLRTKGFK
ncbi:MAG: YibE/F family protein [Clostridia bacterium]|nr:YibE/F family protein [Clostridia bacterium]